MIWIIDFDCVQLSGYKFVKHYSLQKTTFCTCPKKLHDLKTQYFRSVSGRLQILLLILSESINSILPENIRKPYGYENRKVF